tara:strand:- start:458 stop:703 length:246 start_codon:yes stop_codon:yes gene_type:complete
MATQTESPNISGIYLADIIENKGLNSTMKMIKKVSITFFILSIFKTKKIIMKLEADPIKEKVNPKLLVTEKIILAKKIKIG